jgi:hypothetical protein
MDNIEKLISSNKINSKTIDLLISEEFENYKREIVSIETDIESSRNAAKSLNRYADLKTIKSIMQTVIYKVYEESGKEVSYEDFIYEN